MSKTTDFIKNQKYNYGFSDGEMALIKSEPGLNERVVKFISKQKKEPEWMTNFRLKSLKHFFDRPNPSWGPDLNKILPDFNKFTYFAKSSEKQETKWKDVPTKIKNTFQKLGIPEAEQKFLAGVSTQYDSEVVYHSMLKETRDKGIIFTDTDTALREHPELFKKYFNTVVPYDNNKYSALNGAVWSGGSFIYVPKGVVLDKPLQAYFRMNAVSFGQFERTLIIIDEGAQADYVEGCTAPIYQKDSIHAAVVEIFVHKNAKMRYTTIQNWSNNVINLVTKRAHVCENSYMEWIDGNIGSKINMKYPCCVLAEKNASGKTISIAVASKGMTQDSGAKMIHLAPNTSSQIISKSIAHTGGKTDYRGMILISNKATNAISKVECDTLLLDDQSASDTMPTNINNSSSSTIEHEASISKLSEKQLFYLMSRGLSEAEATQLIVMGFIEPFTKELPMEYAAELNQLLKLEMENSIG